MPKALLLTLALACCFCGLAWLALAMEAHWQQLRRNAAGRRTVLSLRALGAAALAAALAICLAADHGSMASLVWVMALAASALAVAMLLAWRPRWLAWLVAWVPERSRAEP